MDKRLKYTIIFSTSLALFGIAYYYYRYRMAFTPTKESVKYDVVLEIAE
jgi:hypothetical protein